MRTGFAETSFKTHNKKFDNLINEKKAINGISDYSNLVITNLSSRNLNNNEYKTLTYGLRQEIALSPTQNDILAFSEAFCDQLESKNALKKDFISFQIAKFVSMQ